MNEQQLADAISRADCSDAAQINRIVQKNAWIGPKGAPGPGLSVAELNQVAEALDDVTDAATATAINDRITSEYRIVSSNPGGFPN